MIIITIIFMYMYPYLIHASILVTLLVNSDVAQSVVIKTECLSHILATINLAKRYIPSFYFPNIVYRIMVYAIFKHRPVQHSQS
jgi:hypothetical protein